jgi:hypothetical protein
MLDRFSAWVGAAAVTAGVSAGMLAGAGMAVADDGSSSPGAGGTGSTSSSSTESKDDSAPDTGDDSLEAATTNSKSAGARGSSAAQGATVKAAQAGPDERSTERPRRAGALSSIARVDDDGTELRSSNSDAKPGQATTGADGSLARVTQTESRAVETQPEDPDLDKKAVEPPLDTEATTQPTSLAVRLTSVVDQGALAKTIAAPEVEAVTFAAAPSSMAATTAAAQPFSSLLSAVGTIVFNVYGALTRLVGGPPVLPPGSTVTVRSSTLQIDCAEGYEVPADWYFPNGAELDPPERLIYLQHGFLASGPWYSHTAAALAEQTNSIVVAPSITSNFLSCDACWLGAPPMHEAMANLFKEGNTALADSAAAAGYSGPIPDRVVLIGHSLGGGAVAGMSGDMVDNGSIGRLAGVVMLDGVPFDPAAADSLKRVPASIPIYQLAAPTYFWNQDGVGSAALLQARPNQFVGVTLVDGSHVDAMRGGNPLIQFSQQLVSGFSTPQNVAAAQILMVGWVNDMFDGTKDDGLYAFPSGEITIDTPNGVATAIALPNTLTKPFPLNFLMSFMSLGDGLFTLQPTCGPAGAGSCEPLQAA